MFRVSRTMVYRETVAKTNDKTTQKREHPVSTIVKILKVNPVESGVARQSQKPYEWHTAECVLLDEAGGAVSVGRLIFPKELRESLGGVPPPGTYRAVIKLGMSTSADRAGDIVPRITELIPIAA